MTEEDLTFNVYIDEVDLIQIVNCVHFREHYRSLMSAVAKCQG
jgi:hypothetical protein